MQGVRWQPCLGEKYSRGIMDDSDKVVVYPLPNDPNDARADRSTAKTCHRYNPMGLSSGYMNERNCAVMQARLDSGKLVRNEQTDRIPRMALPVHDV